MATTTVRVWSCSIAAGSASNVGGAPTMGAALSDSNDGTYVLNGNICDLLIQFDTLALPAGAAVTSVTPRYRFKYVVTPPSPAENLLYASILPEAWSTGQSGVGTATDKIAGSTSFGTYTGATRSTNPATGVAWTQTDLDGHIDLKMTYRKDPYFIDAHTSELYLDVVYNTPSVASAVTVSTQVREDALVSWTYSDPDGNAQNNFQIKIFTDDVVGGGGFDATSSAHVYDTGTVGSGATSYTVDANLSPGHYYAYVRTGDTGTTSWSPWAASADFRVINSPLMML